MKFKRTMMRPAEASKSVILRSSSDLKLRRRFLITDEEIPGNMRWGRLLEVLDKLAEDIALEYVQKQNKNAKVVTAAVDDIMLRDPVDIQQDLFLDARINYVGRTSMEVGIRDRKSTRLNSSHVAISYAVFCLKKKKHARQTMVD